MAIVTYEINFSPTPGSYGTLIEYRIKDTTEWITPTTNPNPTLFSPYLLPLDDSYEYDIRISANGGNCTKKYSYTEILFGSTEYIWVADTKTCEQTDIFMVDQTYTGFSSPYLVYYNPDNEKCYVADGDYTSGNAYWFDPTTFSGIGDINLISGLTTSIYNAKVDKENNRIYFVGLNSGGLKVLDMSTDTFSTTAYGSDGSAFNRIFLFVGDSNIYANDGVLGRFYIIDRTSLSLTSNQLVSSIPSGSTYLNGDFSLIQVGSELWSIAGFRSTSTIGVYNLSLTSLITTIPIAGAIGESSGANYRQRGFYDETYDRVYISDAGSKAVYVFDGSSRTLIKTIAFSNSQGKANALCTVTADPTSDRYFLSYQGYDSVSETDQNYRVYILNRSDSTFKNMILDEYFNELSLQAGTQYLWGSNPETLQWQGGSGWDTDGTITKYTL